MDKQGQHLATKYVIRSGWIDVQLNKCNCCKQYDGTSVLAAPTCAVEVAEVAGRCEVMEPGKAKQEQEGKKENEFGSCEVVYQYIL